MRNYDLDGIFITSPIYTKLSQRVKDLPATRETWIRSLGWEDPLEKGTHSSILAWRIPRVTKNQTQLSDFHFHHQEAI